MPLIDETISSSRAVAKALRAHDEFFRCCEFSSAPEVYDSIDGVFVSCAFRDIDFYWALFNSAIFVDCRFEDCLFRGVIFAGCRIVNCIFRNCHFLRGNLDGPCSSPDTDVYGCQAENCEGFNELFAYRVAARAKKRR